MPKAIESVINFLTHAKKTHNAPELIDRYLAHGAELETQVNVAPDGGERVKGSRSTFVSEDGLTKWFNFRIPKNTGSNASGEEEFRDYELPFLLDQHVQGIATTGWLWREKRSLWVGFDFDALTDHSGVGISRSDLEQVQEKVAGLPYVETRKSTGGNGLHLYILLDENFSSQNHHEHAAIARAIQDVMSFEVGFDFNAKSDICGGMMWLWHRKSKDTLGLTLVKPAERVFRLDELPDNWRDHIPVVSRKRSAVRIQGIAESDQDPFEMLASAHRRIPLSDKHRQIMDALATVPGATVSWISDHHLLQTHTKAFDHIANGYDTCENCGHGIEPEPDCIVCKGSGQQKVADRLGLDLVGVFQTNSPGTDLATPNVFCYPLDNGAWKLYRFSPGISEAKTWDCDGKSWTTCFFNAQPNLKTAAAGAGGKKLQSGGFEFSNVEKAVEAAKLINPSFDLDINPNLQGRKAIVKSTKEGNLSIEVPKEKGDPEEIGEWNTVGRKNYWSQVFDIPTESGPSTTDVAGYDDIIRSLETPASTNAGWAIRKRTDGEWTQKPASSVKMILQHLGHPKSEAETIMGYAEHGPWKLVSLPFQPEYPGDRQWNLDAPQLRYQPLDREEMTSDPHPYWDRLFDHVGSDLDAYLKELDWARTSGVLTGADYLRAWFASILKYPFERTPYLFLFGGEDTGKSTLHEAFELLVTGGVVKADRALTSQSDFNGELANAILCVVEEKNISKVPGALNKIKDAVTAMKLSIRKMRQDSYMIDNSTHWIQCSNEEDACPVFAGDTRITMIHVPPIAEGQQIPKQLLLQHLKYEAPAFLRTLLDMDLPPVRGRLRVPVVETNYKQRAQDNMKTSLEIFIEENVFESPGQLVAFTDYYDAFMETLPRDERHEWSRRRVSRETPMKFAIGAGSSNRKYLTNCSLGEPDGSVEDSTPYVVVNKKIKRS